MAAARGIDANATHRLHAVGSWHGHGVEAWRGKRIPAGVQRFLGGFRCGSGCKVDAALSCGLLLLSNLLPCLPLDVFDLWQPARGRVTTTTTPAPGRGSASEHSSASSCSQADPRRGRTLLRSFARSSSSSRSSSTPEPPTSLWEKGWGRSTDPGATRRCGLIPRSRRSRIASRAFSDRGMASS